MTSLSRKLKRQKKLKFHKDVRKSLKTFEKSVRCTECDRVPDIIHGEKVDKWQIIMENESFQLTCPQCVETINVDE
jgi:Zn finger protein HypA/HybF involved in hydrogenase expression